MSAVGWLSKFDTALIKQPWLLLILMTDKIGAQVVSVDCHSIWVSRQLLVPRALGNSSAAILRLFISLRLKAMMQYIGGGISLLLLLFEVFN